LKAVESFLQVGQPDDKSNIKPSPYVNVKDIRDQNCLHLLAESLNDENKDVILKMMDILLSYGCNINSPNDEQETPFYIIARKLPYLQNAQEIFDKLLKSTQIDFHIHKGDEIVKMIKDKYMETMPEKENFTVCYEEMKNLLESGDINKFETLFSYYTPTENDQNFLDDCYSYLEIAVQKSYINIVDLLIKKGIDFNRLPVANRAERIPPPFLAYKNGNIGIFKSFLLAKEHQKDRLMYRRSQCDSGYEIDLYYGDKKTTLLHQFFSNTKGNQIIPKCQSIKMSKNEKKCFKLLINDTRCDQKYLNALDEHDKPVIYYTVKYGVDYMTFKLLKKGAYIGPVVTKIRKSLLSDLLDSSITSNDEFHDSPNYEITANYGFLMPPVEHCENVRIIRNGTTNKDEISLHTLNGNSRKGSRVDLEQNNPANSNPNGDEKHQTLEMDAIKMLADDYDYRQFVMHPVLSSFIFLKWKKIRFALHINLLTTLLFILTFIPYIMIDRYIKESQKAMKDQVAEEGETTKNNEGVLMIHNIFFGLAFFSVFVMVLRESFQFSLMPIRHYFLSFTNWIDLTLIITSLIVLFTKIELPIIQTIIIILATSECFHRCSYLPFLSVSLHAKIFRKILGTFLKSLAFFSIMIIGFVLASYTLYSEKISKLMNTTVIMNISDVPIVSLKDENPVKEVGVLGIRASVDDETYIGLCALILFIVAILLHNVLNALTVSDAQEIKSDGKLIDLCERIFVMCRQEQLYNGTKRINNMLHHAESLFPDTLEDGKICLKPNQTYETLTSEGKALRNNWLQNILCYFDRHMTMDSEILRNMRTLLVKKREDLVIKDYKERRFEKMVNDVLKLNEQKKCMK